MMPSAQSVTDDRGAVPIWLRLRQAIALPIYAVALILDLLSGALGCLAARIAGDDWPR
jgi:hypothetical protein